MLINLESREREREREREEERERERIYNIGNKEYESLSMERII
jgi:hypothetical protein